MANETRYIKTPFAQSGTRAEVPNVSVGGAVGFDTGFGPDYELPQGAAGRKRIERDKYNGVLYDVTKNLKQWQEKLYPTWIEDDGTGVPFSYPVGMVVNHSGTDWKSVEAGNQEEPGTGVKWVEFFVNDHAGSRNQKPGNGSAHNADDINYNGIETVRSIIDKNKNAIKNINTINRSGVNVGKNYSTWGMRAPWSILGDSISHGAFAPQLYYNGITRILSRMFGAETGGLSYQGFVPMYSLGSGPTLSIDIHSVNFAGTWANNDQDTTLGAASYNGIAANTTAVNSNIAVTIPTFQSKAIVWYMQQPSGGELTVVVNGAIVATINTSGVLAQKSVIVATSDNAQGSCVIVAQKTDNTASPVAVCGFGYIEDIETPVVHNFSQSGRRLRYVAEQTIIDCVTNHSVFMLSLGHNDQGDADSTPAYAAEFTQRINWIIEYANQSNVQVVVTDYCWLASDNSFTRKELKRCADETNGIYIPFPNLFKSDGSIVDSAYLITTLGMFEDGSHPNIKGNKWIAETIAKYMRLSVNSKKQAISFYDYWMPLEIPVGTENSFPVATTVSAYRINGSNIDIRIAVQKDPSSAFPVGAHVLQNAWRQTLPVLPVGSSVTDLGMINQSTGEVTSTILASLSGGLTLVVHKVFINDQQANTSVKCSM